MPLYLPYKQRQTSSQYQDVLRELRDKGEIAETRQGDPALTRMMLPSRYDVAQGAAITPARDISMFFRTAINELAAFINGVRTNDGLREYGVNWWGDWTTEEKCAKRGLETGDIGPGSYGAAFHDFPMPSGGGFDQFKHLVEQIREYSEMRTHFVTPWIPFYIARGEGKDTKVTIAPCHGWVHVRVFGRGLHLHMFQRSGDVPVGVPSNLTQYFALGIMLEHLTGHPFVEFCHTISDAHIYTEALEVIQPLLERKPRRLPLLSLNDEGREVTDIHDFRGQHFELEEYEPYPAITGIPLAI